MRVILVRHADAGDADPARYPDDGARPLTPRGAREHAVVAAALGKLDLGVTHVLASPLTRARQTAGITARAVAAAVEPQATDALGDRFTVGRLLDELGRLPENAVVVCVGHEPHLSRFAAVLLHADGQVALSVHKSGVIAIECAGHPEPGRGRLVFALPARELLRMVK